MKIVQDIPDLVRSNKHQEERKAPAEFHFVGAENLVRGHILFSYNTKTGEWKQATVRREAQVGLDGKPVFKTIVVKEPDCVYVQALNLRNAQKRIKQTTPNF